VIVAPISSQNVGRIYPFEVLVPAGEAGLPQASKILLDQIRAVDKARLSRRLGSLPDARIVEVDRAIRLSLAV
jgi:mRNA interferase MazF